MLGCIAEPEVPSSRLIGCKEWVLWHRGRQVADMENLLPSRNRRVLTERMFVPAVGDARKRLSGNRTAIRNPPARMGRCCVLQPEQGASKLLCIPLN